MQPADWHNWSGSQRHRARVVAPTDVEQVVTAVHAARDAARTVRCVGSAHSFVPFWTDDVIVVLDALDGIRAVDRVRRTATIGAGTKLHALGPLLWAEGLSLPQQGDIDRQSLAGALSTGTHGTGRTLPSLPNFLIGMTLVTADGSVRELTRERDGELFRAAQVGQGVFGIMVDATVALDPAFNLHERTWSCPFAECAAEHAALIEHNRHFEFFWTPSTDACEMKVLNKTDAAPARLGEREYIAPAWQAFPSERDVRFNEMEYSVPFASGWDCFLELRAMLLRDFPKLPWPIEYRTLAADDILLSTAQGRETVTLSVHQGAERDYRPLFDAAEAICRNHAGRPHWGKLHRLESRDLAALYPHFAAFQRHRAALDPDGMFLNDYLRRLLVG
ncbi:MAG: FAD-binding protein [Pseudomonadales bacterium]|nr:FAD-binding protein [Pseudomonadales bacterium]